MQRPIEPKSHAVTSPSSRSRSRSTGSRSREPRGWGSCPSRAHRDSRCSAQTCGLSVDGPKTSHLISPGDWRLVPDPSDRFGVAPPVDITLLAGEKSHVTLDYDGRVPARCSPGAAAGHLDGDDRPDFASHMWVGGEATLGVCAGNGDYYKIRRVVGEPAVEDFDGYGTVEAIVDGSVNRSHPSYGDLPHEPVARHQASGVVYHARIFR